MTTCNPYFFIAESYFTMKIPQSGIRPARCVLCQYNVKLCTNHLWMKMLSFLFVRACAMLHMLYLSCGIPFLFGLLIIFPVLVWLSRVGVIKDNTGNISSFLRSSLFSMASSILTLSSFLRLSLFLRSSKFLRLSLFFRSSSFFSPC